MKNLKTETLIVRVPPAMLKELKELADKIDTPYGRIIRELITKHLSDKK